MFLSLSCHFFKCNLWISGLIQPVCFIQHLTDLSHSWSCFSNDSFQSCSLFSCPIVFPYQHFHISFENHNVRNSWGLSGEGEMGRVFYFNSHSAQSDHFQSCSHRPKPSGAKKKSIKSIIFGWTVALKGHLCTLFTSKRVVHITLNY